MVPYVLPAEAYEWVEVEPQPVEEATTTEVMVEKEPTDPLLCSCVLWINHLNPKAPLVDAKWYATFALSKTPTLGSIAVFKYSNGVHHVGKVTKLKEQTFSLSESNFRKCTQSTRDIQYNDSHLLGFFIP